MWVVIGFIVAALLVGALYYIGWFNEKTHIDTPAGDNVEALDEVITEPPVEPETPPTGE